MSSRQFDEEYNEYMERRERERRRDTATPPKSVRRFQPNSRDPSKPPKSDQQKAQLNGDGNYEIPNNSYHSSGYTLRKSELGEDPISTVRTLRNQLRRMAIACQEKDTPVRAHLCERACDRLSGVEGVLTALARQRTSAVLNGDSRKAEMVARKMEELKEDVVRDTYSDLVMDKNEMKAFGVNSEWTPVKRSEVAQPATPAPPTPEKIKPKPTPITIETQTEALAPIQVGNQNAKMEPERVPNSPPRDVKRNARLATLLAAVEAEQPSAQQGDDPYQLPNNAGTCLFCGESSPDFGIANRLEAHYKSSCQLMSNCRLCSKLVMVSQLTDHLINRCSFVTGRMTRCNACGLAIDATDNANGVGHPMCRGRPPPSGAQWCPLCAVAVNDSKEAWKSHLMSDCYNNPRRSGPELELETLPGILEEKRTRPSSSISTLGKSGARLIDANKLVAALQDAQKRKKQSLKKKTSTVEESVKE